MKKKISIINYILVIMLAMIGGFKIYILNSNMEIKNILGNSIAFEYALAVLLIVPLVLQISMRVFSAHTLEMKAAEQTIIPKKSIKGNKIVMDHTWNPVISIILLFLSILPILFSIVAGDFLVRISTIIAILVYLMLIFTSYLWFYYEILNIVNDKKEALKSVKKNIKNITVFFSGFALIVVVPSLIIYKFDEIRDEKLIDYVLSDIQNPKEASNGYLSIEDIKTKIMNDYYPEDVYYKIIISGKENSVNFVTYIDNSDVVSTYIYELTDDGYKFKLKISNSSISKDDIKKYDGIINNTDDNEISKEKKYSVNSSREFIDYLNSIDYEEYKNYEVVYDNIKFTIIQKEYGYSYEIYYINNKIFENHNLINGGKFYLLKNDENNAFVVVNEMGPVGSHSKYILLIFDITGNILLSDTIIPIQSTEIIVNDNTISYSFESKMQEELELNIMAENDMNFCKYLNENYEDDYVVTGENKYQYKNGKITLIEKNENTIKNYKEKYNCN